VVSGSIDLPADPRIRRILVLKWSAMGDVVISTALFEDIRRAFPDARIDLNTLPPWDRLLFSEDRRFSRVVAIDLRGGEGGWRGAWKWLRAVNRGRYDLLIDLQSNDRSRFLVSLLHLFGRGIPCRIGNHRRFPYNIAPDPPGGVIHPFLLQRRALEAGGIPATTPRPLLHVPERHRQRAAGMASLHRLEPGRYVIFLPGSQAAGWLKRWGAGRYAALADILHRNGIDRTVLIGGGDEEEECRRIEESAEEGGVVNLCGRTEILDIVPLCEGARAIVANDTGTAHVASCTDRPMVVICGPTDPRKVKPVGDNVVALQASIPCINCYKKTCDHDHACMTSITPEQVFETLRPLLAQDGPRGS
jgi:heptosyltransferase-2